MEGDAWRIESGGSAAASHILPRWTHERDKKRAVGLRLDMSGCLAFARRLGVVVHHETDDDRHEDSFSRDDDEAEVQQSVEIQILSFVSKNIDLPPFTTTLVSLQTPVFVGHSTR